MKIRTGFVSNSSSSSFIIRKSKLSEDDLNYVRNLVHNQPWKDSIEEDYDFIWGDVEAHRDINDIRLPDELRSICIDGYNMSDKDFKIEYCGDLSPEDMK